MEPDRMHATVSPDGTRIVGGVHGTGPPLVLVPGGPTDGETGWLGLLPALRRHATCYTVNTRGRGPSDDHPDHARERIVEDIVAFVESIGDEVLLFGHSAGGTHALEAAASTPSVAALALYEPTLFELADRAHLAAATDAVGRARAAIDDGRAGDGAWIFLERLALANDRELARLAELGASQAMGPLMPLVVDEVDRSGLPQLSDLSLVDRVSAPVLLLYGSETDDFYRRVVRHLAARFGDCRVRELPGLGHLGPELEPGPVAAELASLVARPPVTTGP
jgi:pimeloyl-ACP methyl ester carboxylesterase